ncbi:SEC-C motif-containing protein [Algoriphagus faecimaris]|uniref:SEC-C motif-containing protein n=1 Tax=Algoriphagus faecimaris TaxID=686796 RepID=A0A1G6XRF8_9BACT|nr:SEC-C metal-binding domain-containing protein [Algoriphagus faecimaris]SDD80551.1 SEC-C motif-containing protein [Algoriphagus faecimaris]
MPKKSKFEKDFVAVEEFFPKLSYFWNSKSKHWIVKGELDICDAEGDYWETFHIIIGIPQSYPHCVPIVIEKSELIPRDIDWHISKEGACCIDIEHNLIAMSRKGINIDSFIREKVYPYFANQLFKLSEKEYAGKEYKHHFDGIIQYYIEDLNLVSIDTTIHFLERILLKSFIGRNNKCPCGSGKKIKNCHLDEINTIKSIGRKKNRR